MYYTCPFNDDIDEGSTMPSTKNDGMEYDGQQHVAPGSGTAEGYSREGSDADMRLNHHHADPAQASLWFDFRDLATTNLG